MVQLLVNTARPLIFSTAPSPPSVAGALAALELLEAEPERVACLHEAARTLRGALAEQGFAVEQSDMHIVPLVVGDSEAAMRLCQAALERGVFAQAIRPPTVPEGTSRLRLAVMASHTATELGDAAKSLAEATREVGLDPTTTRLAPHRQATTRPGRLARHAVRGLFVTGTGTGVGKTIVSAALLAAMRDAGEQVRAYKPVVTGLAEPPGAWPPDHKLLGACRRKGARGGRAVALRTGRLTTLGRIAGGRVDRHGGAGRARKGNREQWGDADRGGRRRPARPPRRRLHRARSRGRSGSAAADRRVTRAWHDQSHAVSLSRPPEQRSSTSPPSSSLRGRASRRRWSAPTARRSPDSVAWRSPRSKKSHAPISPSLQGPAAICHGTGGCRDRVPSQASRKVGSWPVRCCRRTSSLGGSGVVPPEKGGAMPNDTYVLAITLLVALLVIDRLTR